MDNNTWNNTHIATVGRAMASPEKQAWEIFRSLDCTHVLVVFGGFIGCGFCPASDWQVCTLDLTLTGLIWFKCPDICQGWCC